MKKMVVVVGARLLGLGTVMAQQDQVKDTQAMMKGNGRNAGALAAMVKGEKPYDQATVDAALKQFDDTAKKLPTLFPASLKGKPFDGDYSPSARARATTPPNQSDDPAKKRRPLSPESLKGKPFDGDYSPSDKIWDDKAGFAAHIESFAKGVDEKKGKIKDHAS